MADRASWLAQALGTYERPLLRYTTRLTGDLDAARDVVQDCFLRLCGQRRTDVEDHLAEWLYTVCRNRALDLRRTAHRRGKNMVTLDPDTSRDAGSATAPIATLEARESHAEVRTGIAGLPERDQELLRLKFQEGLSYKQISAVTDLSVSNVGFILHRAIRRLRSELAGSELAGTAALEGRRAGDNGHSRDGETANHATSSRTAPGDPERAGTRARSAGPPEPETRTSEQRDGGRSPRRQA